MKDLAQMQCNHLTAAEGATRSLQHNQEETTPAFWLQSTTPGRLNGSQNNNDEAAHAWLPSACWQHAQALLRQHASLSNQMTMAEALGSEHNRALNDGDEAKAGCLRMCFYWVVLTTPEQSSNLLDSRMAWPCQGLHDRAAVPTAFALSPLKIPCTHRCQYMQGDRMEHLHPQEHPALGK